MDATRFFRRTRFRSSTPTPSGRTARSAGADAWQWAGPTCRRAMVGIAAVAASALAVPAGRAGAAPVALPTGQGVVLNAPIVDASAVPGGGGYWEGGADGGVFAFGDARFYGSTGGLQLNKPIVGMAPTPDGHGYWEVASDGGVFAFGDARYRGSTGSDPSDPSIVGIAPTPDGNGYWLVGSDGGVFSFGDAQFYGSAAGMSAGSPIVGMAPTPDGRGYWEAASDGSVYAFGDAQFGGDAPVGTSVVGISPAGSGYRLAAPDGGVFSFGGAPFYGSTGGQALNMPVIGVTSTDTGYVTVASDGGIFTFGGAGFYGSLGGSTVASGSPWGDGSYGITAFQRAAWTRVNLCEEGGAWDVQGGSFSGGLGFSHANWDRFNTFGFPADAADATPDQQIRVAVAFAAAYWGSPNAAPDQQGCTGGY